MRGALAAWAGVLLVCGGGCNTISSLGLPFSSVHQLSSTANEIREAAGQPIELPRELNKDVLGQYIIEPGDALIVEAADFNSPVRLPNEDQIVKPDGSIDLGKYGRLQAAGKTVAMVQEEVREQIADQEEKPGQFLVRLLRWDSKVFYVLGEVNSPGAYPYSGHETVLDAIVTAGDLTDRANRHKIVFSRPTAPNDCRVVLPVCYNQIVQLGDTSSNYQLLPGDRVFVSSLTIWDDIFQTLLPWSYEKCPRCGTLQIPCYLGLCDDECDVCSSHR